MKSDKEIMIIGLNEHKNQLKKSVVAIVRSYLKDLEDENFDLIALSNELKHFNEQINITEKKLFEMYKAE